MEPTHMNYYMWSTPPEINQLPYPERNRICEAARMRMGFHLPAWWIALGLGFCMGLVMAGLLVMVLSYPTEPAWRIVWTLYSSGFVIGFATGFLGRWLMRRAVRRQLAAENVELSNPR